MRPISITPVFSTVFEKNRPHNHLSSFSREIKCRVFQFRFRPNLSTVSAMSSSDMYRVWWSSCWSVLRLKWDIQLDACVSFYAMVIERIFIDSSIHTSLPAFCSSRPIPGYSFLWAGPARSGSGLFCTAQLKYPPNSLRQRFQTYFFTIKIFSNIKNWIKTLNNRVSTNRLFVNMSTWGSYSNFPQSVSIKPHHDILFDH